MNQKNLLARLEVLAGQASTLARDIDGLKRQLEVEGTVTRKGAVTRQNLGRKSWSEAESARCVQMANEPLAVEAIAEELGRKITSVQSHLNKVLGKDGYRTWRQATAA